MRHMNFKPLVALICLLSTIGSLAIFAQQRKQDGQGPAAITTCTVAALTSFNIPHVNITSATEVAASGLDPAYCNVTGSVVTDGEGAGPGMATFQAKLPVNWNHKYLASGPSDTIVHLAEVNCGFP